MSVDGQVPTCDQLLIIIHTQKNAPSSGTHEYAEHYTCISAKSELPPSAVPVNERLKVFM